MSVTGSQALFFGGAWSATAAAHVACIVLGAPACRLKGAGERMARAAAAGKPMAAAMTLAIAGMRGRWAAYAFAGEGVIAPLPFMKAALPAISAVYPARGLGFPLLKAAFPENSRRFLLVASGICPVIGALHAYGTVARWQEL